MRAAFRVGCLFLALGAEAAVVKTERIEDLATAAQSVVRGKVREVEARWDPSHRGIFTYAKVAISERFKGGDQRLMTIRQPGGEVAGIGQHVAGAAGFTVGEELVVFLEPVNDEPGTFTLAALAAGKVHLDESRATRQLSGLTVAESKGGLRALGGDDLGARAVFLDRVRAACRSAGK